MNTGAFIVGGSIVHFGLLFILILQRISCDIQPHCVSAANKVGVAILGFPLNVILWMLYPHGLGASSWSYLLAMINSLLAVTIIWFVAVRFFIGRRRH
jgi:hypothetical protein